MCMSVDSPPPRNYGTEAQANLSAQIAMQPELLAAFQQYSPLYTAQGLQNLQTSLLGSEASTVSQTAYTPRQVWRNKRTGVMSDTMPTPPTSTDAQRQTRIGGVYTGDLPGNHGPSDGLTGFNANDWEQITVQDPYQVQRQIPGSRGLLDIYSNDILPKLSAAQAREATSQRTSDIRDVERLGPRATAAFRSANPQQASLLDKINLQAQQGLDAGSQWNPEDLNRETSRIRGDWANRGLGTSMPAAIDETTSILGGGENLRRNRQQFGIQTAELNKATSADPFMAILGRPSSAVSTAGGIAGQGQSLISGVPSLNPESAYAQDVWNTNFNADAASRIAEGNANAAVCAAGIQAAGSVVGGAAAGCWVAREVYGDNEVSGARCQVSGELKWRLFQRWLLNSAPAWFRALYMRRGPAFAKFIRNKPRLKNVIRKWMDARIGRAGAPRRPDFNLGVAGATPYQTNRR